MTIIYFGIGILSGTICFILSLLLGASLLLAFAIYGLAGNIGILIFAAAQIKLHSKTKKNPMKRHANDTGSRNNRYLLQHDRQA